MAVNQRHKSGGKNRNKSDKDRESSTSQAGATGFAGDMAEHASDYMSRGATQFREMTRDHEGTAVVVALATGFGVGLLIGCALTSSRSDSSTWRDRVAAEGLGRRLLERVEGMLPNALSEYVRR